MIGAAHPQEEFVRQVIFDVLTHEIRVRQDGVDEFCEADWLDSLQGKFTLV